MVEKPKSRRRCNAATNLAVLWLIAVAGELVPSFEASAAYLSLAGFGDGSTDVTSKVQKAIDENTELVVYFPQTANCYKISSELRVPINKSVSFTGDGPEFSELLQSNADAGAITFSGPTAGNVSGLTIAAGTNCYPHGGAPKSIQSKGIAVNVTSANNAFTVDNIFIKGFSTGLNIDATWQGMFSRIWGYGLGTGIQIGCNRSYGQGSGNHFRQILLSQNSFDPQVVSRSIGIKYCQGGQYFSDVESDGFDIGWLVQPVAQGIEGASFTNAIADTALSDGFVFDAGSGDITSVRMTAPWSGFNNGTGIRIKGVSPHKCSGLTIVGAALRENGLSGIDESIGCDTQVLGGEIVGNARGQLTVVNRGSGCRVGDVLTIQGGALPPENLPMRILVTGVGDDGEIIPSGFQVVATGYYSELPTEPATASGGHCNPANTPTFRILVPRYSPGAHIAAGVGQWTFSGVTFGNVATGTTSQAASLSIEAGSNPGSTYRNNITQSAAPNSGIAAVENASSSPINWDETISTATSADIGGGSTTYLGPVGNQPVRNSGLWLGRTGTITELLCSTTKLPDRQQSRYSFQIDVNGKPVGRPGQISGGSYSTGLVPQSIPIEAAEGFALQAIASAGAVASGFSCYIAVAH